MPIDTDTVKKWYIDIYRKYGESFGYWAKTMPTDALKIQALVPCASVGISGRPFDVWKSKDDKSSFDVVVQTLIQNGVFFDPATETYNTLLETQYAKQIKALALYHMDDGFWAARHDLPPEIDDNGNIVKSDSLATDCIAMCSAEQGSMGLLTPEIQADACKLTFRVTPDRQNFAPIWTCKDIPSTNKSKQNVWSNVLQEMSKAKKKGGLELIKCKGFFSGNTWCAATKNLSAETVLPQIAMDCNGVAYDPNVQYCADGQLTEWCQSATDCDSTEECTGMGDEEDGWGHCWTKPKSPTTVVTPPPVTKPSRLPPVFFPSVLASPSSDDQTAAAMLMVVGVGNVIANGEQEFDIADKTKFVTARDAMCILPDAEKIPLIPSSAKAEWYVTNKPSVCMTTTPLPNYDPTQVVQLLTDAQVTCTGTKCDFGTFLATTKPKIRRVAQKRSLK